MLNHEAFMSRAIELAKKGKGSVSPNPLVGCVLVKDGEIIGEGYHEQFGGDHAEVMAFRNAIKDPIDCSVYVNLEPCNIDSKTPPCTKFLKENGAAEVFISTIDPNPDISGNGIKDLNRMNIKTTLGVLEDEAREINKGFFKWVKTGRPWLIVKIAQSSNRKMGKDNTSSHWITNDISRKHSHSLRSEVDAILIGKNTAKVDNPSLTVRLVNGNNPIRVITDTHRTLPQDLSLFNDNESNTIVLCSSNQFSDNHTSHCEYIGVNEINNLLDPTSILLELANHGITSTLLEGGPTLINSFYKEGLIDEVYEYTSSEELDAINMDNPINIDDSWEYADRVNLGDDILKIFLKKEVECLAE
tara:strand:+ start:101 stop:1174 length:1074 start_codon:yes stop_codon:yes gene_type:complete